MGEFSPWHIAILVVVLVVLFGARRLPGAAQSLGQSMHIFKKSVQGLHPDDQDSAANPSANAAAAPWGTSPTTPPPAVTAPDPTQQQLLDLQRQVQELQRNGGGNGQPAEAQTPQSF